MDAGIKVAQIIPIVVPKVDKTDRLKSDVIQTWPKSNLTFVLLLYANLLSRASKDH